MSDLALIRDGCAPFDWQDHSETDNTGILIEWLIRTSIKAIDKGKPLIDYMISHDAIAYGDYDIIDQIFHPKWIKGYISHLSWECVDRCGLPNETYRCEINIRKNKIRTFITGFHQRPGRKSPLLAFARSPIFDRQLLRVLRCFAGD